MVRALAPESYLFCRKEIYETSYQLQAAQNFRVIWVDVRMESACSFWGADAGSRTLTMRHEGQKEFRSAMA